MLATVRFSTSLPSPAMRSDSRAIVAVSLAPSATWLMLTVSSSTAAAMLDDASLCWSDASSRELAVVDSCSAALASCSAPAAI
jgi:hypothetical protein